MVEVDIYDGLRHLGSVREEPNGQWSTRDAADRQVALVPTRREATDTLLDHARRTRAT